MIKTTNTNDIYQRGNDYDQYELLYKPHPGPGPGPGPCGPYVTVKTFNTVVNNLIAELNKKVDKLDIGYIEYEEPKEG